MYSENVDESSVAVVEKFVQAQIHNKDCLHAGMRKTHARVQKMCTCNFVYLVYLFRGGLISTADRQWWALDGK